MSSASASVTRPASPVPGPQAAPVLHRHAVESVLGWLGLRDLSVAAHLSKLWAGAAATMAPARLTAPDLVLSPESNTSTAAASEASHTAAGLLIDAILAAAVGQRQSVLLRHLGSLKATLDEPLLQLLRRDTTAALEVLRAALPNLQHLDCHLDDDDEVRDPVYELDFSPTLRKLIVRVDPVWFYRPALLGVSRLSDLRELDFSIYRSDSRVSHKDLVFPSVLQGLVNLERFRYYDGDFSDRDREQVSGIHRLANDESDDEEEEEEDDSRPTWNSASAGTMDDPRFRTFIQSVCETLCAWPNLRRASVGGCIGVAATKDPANTPTAMLARVQAARGGLQSLEELRSNYFAFESHPALLRQLPGLTALQYDDWLRDMSILRELPALRSLSLSQPDSAHGGMSVEAYAAGLDYVSPHLTNLCLGAPVLSDPLIRWLLRPAFPALQQLVLHCDRIPAGVMLTEEECRRAMPHLTYCKLDFPAE